ncbi:MAG: hypothetical protein IGS48_15950 [Oscillatoriales cyanobacterium C42_A2020_001]|nr:hypothetical protein [Leptolyngbyaceae cyanobacterium C42_A2020_001]
MQITNNQLFTALSAEESANVNGASGYYYWRPVYHCYPVVWGGSGGSWGGSSGGSSVNQTVNVNVQIED